MNMPTFPVTGAGANMNPISFVNAPAPWGWAFEIPSPNGANPHMDGWMANAGWKSADSGVCIQNKWAYYALTYDGTSVSIYTNGVLAKSVASSGYSQVSAGNPLLIGAYYDSGTADRFYKGAMAKVAVYTNALSSTRVLAHWQAGTNAP